MPQGQPHPISRDTVLRRRSETAAVKIVCPGSGRMVTRAFCDVRTSFVLERTNAPHLCERGTTTGEPVGLAMLEGMARFLFRFTFVTGKLPSEPQKWPRAKAVSIADSEGRFVSWVHASFATLPPCMYAWSCTRWLAHPPPTYARPPTGATPALCLAQPFVGVVPVEGLA